MLSREKAVAPVCEMTAQTRSEHVTGLDLSAACWLVPSGQGNLPRPQREASGSGLCSAGPVLLRVKPSPYLPSRPGYDPGLPAPSLPHHRPSHRRPPRWSRRRGVSRLRVSGCRARAPSFLAPSAQRLELAASPHLHFHPTDGRSARPPEASPPNRPFLHPG